ncbi:MAG: type II toxin-antitoxin system VapC family toxin [Coriobacteriales bacterium]|jgi:PIN domain nuclease of toxin-antitoxin system|nr:type II toxin-antitoxin system VapC family toxin [Coriobacteriales bacterium]
MKCLLDTCSLIWLLSEPNKLTERAKETIRNRKNDVYASTLSFWEMSLKHSIGKFNFENIEIEEIDALLVDDLYIGIIGLSEQETLSFYRLPFFGEHRDPFDRMLAWQAIKRDMALITGDADFAQYHQCGLRTLW